MYQNYPDTCDSLEEAVLPEVTLCGKTIKQSKPWFVTACGPGPQADGGQEPNGYTFLRISFSTVK